MQIIHISKFTSFNLLPVAKFKKKKKNWGALSFYNKMSEREKNKGKFISFGTEHNDFGIYALNDVAHRESQWRLPHFRWDNKFDPNKLNGCCMCALFYMNVCNRTYVCFMCSVNTRNRKMVWCLQTHKTFLCKLHTFKAFMLVFYAYVHIHYTIIYRCLAEPKNAAAYVVKVFLMVYTYILYLFVCEC